MYKATLDMFWNVVWNKISTLNHEDVAPSAAKYGIGDFSLQFTAWDV